MPSQRSFRALRRNHPGELQQGNTAAYGWEQGAHRRWAKCEHRHGRKRGANKISADLLKALSNKGQELESAEEAVNDKQEASLLVTTSKALVTTSVALVTNSFLSLLVRHLLLLAWHLLLIASCHY